MRQMRYNIILDIHGINLHLLSATSIFCQLCYMFMVSITACCSNNILHIHGMNLHMLSPTSSLSYIFMVWIWILGTFYNIMLHIHGKNLNICEYFTILCYNWEHFTKLCCMFQLRTFYKIISRIPLWILTFRAKLTNYLTHSRYQF